VARKHLATLLTRSEIPLPSFGTGYRRAVQRSKPNSQLRSDCTPGAPLCAQPSNSRSIHDLLRPAELLSLRARVPQTRFDPLHDETALQFGHSAQDGKDHLPGGGGRVELLRQADELNAEGLEVLQSPQQVRHRSREPIKPPNHNDIEASAVSVGLDTVPIMAVGFGR
jgi:hypothetical protein